MDTGLKIARLRGRVKIAEALRAFYMAQGEFDRAHTVQLTIDDLRIQIDDECSVAQTGDFDPAQRCGG